MNPVLLVKRDVCLKKLSSEINFNCILANRGNRVVKRVLDYEYITLSTPLRRDLPFCQGLKNMQKIE